MDHDDSIHDRIREMANTSSVSCVILERIRQKRAWSASHDDAHTDGDLARAAAYLADPDSLTAGGCIEPDDPEEVAEAGWAVQLLVKHRDDRRKQLVIAAALIIAEIDRLDRAEFDGG